MDQLEVHFAPLQGYADHIYRNLHSAIYGGVDYYYTPFIRLEKGEARRQDINRLKASQLTEKDKFGIHPTLIPQIIFNSVEEFRILTTAIKDLGFNHINLNLGCPYPMQTRKGRGASMIANRALMEQIAQEIEKDFDAKYSIKMRLGILSPNECIDLLPILNQTPLEQITLHPRLASQLYEGELDYSAFTQFAEKSKNKVIWNGDLHSLEDINDIKAKYPQLSGVMIGRGLLTRPSLAAEYRAGKEWEKNQQLTKLRNLHDQLLEQYEDTLCGQTQILQKIKPFWDYLEPEIGHKCYKAIHKATSLMRYRDAVLSAFDNFQ